MSRARVRTPAIVPVAPEPAAALIEDPSIRVTAHFEQVWADAMHDMPFVNPALRVEPVGFQRVEGDWLGVVVTPWFINLFLLPGGGALWRDLPTGEQRAVALPVGELEFIGDNPGAGAAVAAYQYCPLISPVQHIESQQAARVIARDALATVLAPPAAAPPSSAPDQDRPAADASGSTGVVSPPSPAGEVASPSRRGFLRALSGSRKA